MNVGGKIGNEGKRLNRVVFIPLVSQVGSVKLNGTEFLRRPFTDRSHFYDQWVGFIAGLNTW